MQHTKNILLALLTAGTCLLGACSPKVSAPVAGPGTPSKPPAAEPRFSAAQLEEGHTLYTNNCGKCHKLFRPDQKSLAKWESVLPGMVRKAKLSNDQGALVRAWVLSNNPG